MEMKVGDVMTRGVITAKASDTVQHVAEIMKENDISSVMVIEKGDGVGIVTERDILIKIVAESKDPRKVKLEDIMTSPLITIKPGSDIEEAARIMRDRDIRRLIVADKNGKVIGILTEFDIVRVEPALHTLVRARTKWELSEAQAAVEGTISGICDECENYSENLRNVDGRMLCEDCESK